MLFLALVEQGNQWVAHRAIGNRSEDGANNQYRFPCALFRRLSRRFI
jgi:hypothetical protein